MKTNSILTKALMLLLLLAPFIIYAQKQVKLIKSDSKLTIKGTSSLHDWEEKAHQFDCDLQLLAKGNELISIDKGSFWCIVKSIESGNSLMNSKTYEALKANIHPELKFILKNVDKISLTGGKYTCTISGDVNIAGVTKNISIPISGTIQNNKLTVNGSTVIDMPSYGVVPPTALMGTIKTGREVTVSFSLSFLL